MLIFYVLRFVLEESKVGKGLDAHLRPKAMICNKCGWFMIVVVIVEAWWCLVLVEAMDVDDEP